ncbi:carbon monoxide dehydrogenase [Methylovirgula ligni]|uniref:Carbon monoxide dehydrogenase medium subunit n=1 Tax=Methylovirgula ligni TaxID=569860 RepID=A0A3D9Z1V4_9HYPH|nr:xanthine dehydrogenase family protein subunit M [Methylovirgula ligni]QAY95519.1 carbon monoxide dehydrogenase [Methylovirgula ligni]REF89144.1 carbon monoxide dehydrogenase medium subunit [Methylovirgula ligni]
MIPGSFTYHRPKSLPEALALLADLGDDARPLAGGQSLIPLMKFRMATPANLIDLSAISDLKGIRVVGSDIVLGAMTTQYEMIGSDLMADKVPLMREAAGLVADPQVRYMGTVGGNAANGDPGNDMPAIMMALGAIYTLASKTGTRQVPARDFYKGLYYTALEPGEMITAINIPVPAKGHGYAYNKLKRKIGDYATAAAAVMLTLSGGKVASCAITLTNVADHALYAEEASRLVLGTEIDASAIKRAAAAAEDIATPAADNHGPVEYRKKMAGVMVARALARAKVRAADRG